MYMSSLLLLSVYVHVIYILSGHIHIMCTLSEVVLDIFLPNRQYQCHPYIISSTLYIFYYVQLSFCTLSTQMHIVHVICMLSAHVHIICLSSSTLLIYLSIKVHNLHVFMYTSLSYTLLSTLSFHTYCLHKCTLSISSVCLQMHMLYMFSFLLLLFAYVHVMHIM